MRRLGRKQRKAEQSERTGLMCQCGHGQCYHFGGQRACMEHVERHGYMVLCACQKFIEVPAVVPLDELEQWARMKVTGDE
jgi:hypothetical protein